MLFNGNVYLLSAFLPLDFSRRYALLYRAYVETEVAADAVIV